MSCKGRVTNVVWENCTMTVYFSDCTSVTYDTSNCGDKTPVIDDPGPGPDPHPVSDVRCRVARKVANNIVDNRYIDFLEAATPAAAATGGVGMAAVTSAALAGWAWSAAIYPSLWAYGMSVALTSDQANILAYWNSNQTLVRDTVAEALYCVLPDSGAIDTTVRDLFRVALDGFGELIYSRLAEFMGMYPLERLRDEAFEASITTDAVDCEAFDCEGSGIPNACNSQAINWIATNATPAQFEAQPPGAVDHTLWGGEDLTIFPDEPTITFEMTTRNPNENWKATGAASPQNNRLRYMGIVWTPDEPCVVTRLTVGTISNSGGGSKMVAIVAQLMDNSWFVLRSFMFGPAPITDQPILTWEGDPTTVQAVLFMTGHYRGSGPVTIQIRDTNINV